MNCKNETIKVKVKRLYPDAILPSYAKDGDAGMDVIAFAKDNGGAYSYLLSPGTRRLIPTGIAIELPPYYQAEVRPRSGLALNKGITVLNTPGTIDSGYRGEVGVILINHGNETVHISHGDKIAQLVIMPVPRVVLEVVDELSDSERGEGGFGHTGDKAEALEYDSCI